MFDSLVALSRIRSLALSVGLSLLLAQPALAGRPLRPVSVPSETVDGLRATLSDRCRDQVRDELRRGQRYGSGCGQDREAIGRAAVRRRDRFGFVERRQVNLSSLRLTLGWAQACRQWPLRHPDRDVLRRTDVDGAGCRLGRYEGPLVLTFIDRRGGRHQPLAPTVTDQDGRVTLHFATLDRTLRALGAGSLDDYVRIELGEAAWGGHIDLEQLLTFRADWHLNWVSQGRGAAGLFAVRHPEHPGAGTARTLAAEAQLARQLRDYEQVRAGELPPQRFFDHHVRSPYHRPLRMWMRAQQTVER